MSNFVLFLAREGNFLELPATNSLAYVRKLALDRPKDFLRFRCTIARDFLADIRVFARTIKKDALITCNNSLNSPEAFYSQSRGMAYNIYEMTKAEDFVVVEDMNTQPRSLANGTTIEYGPIYEMLDAISHHKPVVAVTVAEGDYHTAPNLVRLAMAEAVAHRSSYLSWPTWPENERVKMISTIRPQADLFRRQEKILNETEPRMDALLFLPFRRWVDRDDCPAERIAVAMTRANVQYVVTTEDDLAKKISKNWPQMLGKPDASPVLAAESESIFNASEKKLVENFQKSGGQVVFANEEGWFQKLQSAINNPSVMLQAPPSVRVVMADQPQKTIVHLYNLNIQRLSSFDDKVMPATNVRLQLRVPLKKVHSVKALTADIEGTAGKVNFTSKSDRSGTMVEATIPNLKISTLLLIE